MICVIRVMPVGPGPRIGVRGRLCWIPAPRVGARGRLRFGARGRLRIGVRGKLCAGMIPVCTGTGSPLPGIG